ncbi:hypothetical protein K439DRAFT_1356664 [Ramaria rubella]|nr:hypothetical protein K439DRAFT_1356664 [Ramaria rubella]
MQDKPNSNINTSSSPAKKPPLTHFLSLPIGHHPALRDQWVQISSALLDSSPSIPGLHESIIVKPGGLHVTLGVLSLVSRERQQKKTSRRHTIDEALRLLQSLEAPIKHLLANECPLIIPLEFMDVMRSRPNQKLEQSHVMWAGPDLASNAGKRLNSVCELIHATFKNAGMLQDDRPLKLHCTLINTVYRKEKATGEQKRPPRKNNKRVPFSFSAILSSSAFAQIARPTTVGAGADAAQGSDALHGAHSIDLGSWIVEEVQLCEMGSKGADGAYRSVGSLKLLHD